MSNHTHYGHLGWISAPETNAPFAKLITNLRLDLRLNIRQMAALIGVTKSTYSAYENGQTEPRLSGFVSIAHKLNYLPQDLFNKYL